MLDVLNEIIANPTDYAWIGGVVGILTPLIQWWNGRTRIHISAFIDDRFETDDDGDFHAYIDELTVDTTNTSRQRLTITQARVAQYKGLSRFMFGLEPGDLGGFARFLPKGYPAVQVSLIKDRKRHSLLPSAVHSFYASFEHLVIDHKFTDGPIYIEVRHSTSNRWKRVRLRQPKPPQLSLRYRIEQRWDRLLGRQQEAAF